MSTQVKDSGLKFHPKKGDVLMCDFRGNIIPEIVKKRPVVVYRQALSYRPELVMVVPLSTTPPLKPVDYCVPMSKNYGAFKKGITQYAKCDLICSVSLKRLDRMKVGYRTYQTPKISTEDFESIQRGVRCCFEF